MQWPLQYESRDAVDTRFSSECVVSYLRLEEYNRTCNAWRFFCMDPESLLTIVRVCVWRCVRLCVWVCVTFVCVPLFLCCYVVYGRLTSASLQNHCEFCRTWVSMEILTTISMARRGKHHVGLSLTCLRLHCVACCLVLYWYPLWIYNLWMRVCVCVWMFMHAHVRSELEASVDFCIVLHVVDEILLQSR